MIYVPIIIIIIIIRIIIIHTLRIKKIISGNGLGFDPCQGRDSSPPRSHMQAGSTQHLIQRVTGALFRQIRAAGA
jgi:hypothetical protein